MAKKQELTHEVHDHFNKANVLHKYVSEDLGLARNHALETGQELMAAKAGCPPGSWEEECKRLFNGSARTARFYMAFAKHMGALPKTASHAVLMLEGTLEGAAKAAKAAAKPKPPKPEPETDPKEPIDVDSEPSEETGAEPATPAQVQAAVESAREDDAELEVTEQEDTTEPGVMSQIRKLVLGYEPPAAMVVFLRDLVDQLKNQ